jgi:long-chain acyl-CoA synthetase
MSKNLIDALNSWGEVQDSAEAVVAAMEQSLACGLPAELWHDCLRRTGTRSFLMSLGDDSLRKRWAEACFGAIRRSGYALRHMFEQRVNDFPDKILFQDMSSTNAGRWTYRSAARQIREIAASLFLVHPGVEPRVALLMDNSAEGAFCDLACLFCDILNTPLNTHFDSAAVSSILEKLRINVVVTDTEKRRDFLKEIAARNGFDFRIVVLDAAIADERSHILHLGKSCKRLSEAEISSVLKVQKRMTLDQVATVMFTTGSAGETKGISFSQYHLVTKRFARAASLPEVGDDEVLLCYLPFFHTFGRYLEMLGTIYWGGTYVFAGNPSFETMVALLPKVNPTGLISIPLRWAQLREHCISESGSSGDRFRAIVGNRLRWGLSAAGYLDPRAFRFFIGNGVDLCSGFGVTEATGGIMMTPPGRYVESTLGIPLPGIGTRLTEQGELQISGHYVARPLEEKGPGDMIPIPDPDRPDPWYGTGDLFRILPNGYYTIVDRIKDIYKNDRGQTISPRKVEKAFEGVPGIRSTFLAGDARPYNILLIVPEEQDPGLRACDPDRRREFFRPAVSSANRELPPYERVVDFVLLDRDFSLEKGELSLAGTFNRKTIEANFAHLLEPLFRSGTIAYAVGAAEVRIPRWFFRDSGVLEDEIEARSDGLYNRTSKLELRLKQKSEEGTWLIGDLEYSLEGRTVDLGLFARQPRLWLGNPSLVAFCPCKNGWDVPLANVSPQVARPSAARLDLDPAEFPRLAQIRETKLAAVNQLICTALFSATDRARAAIEAIGRMLPESDLKWNDVMRRRLEALAWHPEERVRCLAYQVLLLDDPTPEYSKAFTAFIESGLPFLNREAIEAIASSRFEKSQLESFRRRLAGYREHLRWPADEAGRARFRDIFELLINFVEAHPDFYSSVRAELAVWSLFEADPELAESGRTFLSELRKRLERHTEQAGPVAPLREWKQRLVYDDGFPEPERRRISKLLARTHFLKQSVMLAFDESDFSIEGVPEEGIWLSPLSMSGAKNRSYRASINLRNGKHFDLEIVLGDDFRNPATMETLYWSLALAGHPRGPRVLAQPGCFHAEMRARSSAHPGQLTVWEKIREYADLHGPGAPVLKPHAWRKLFVQGLAVFYRGWQNSGCRIVPGVVSPGNSLVPELDFQDGGLIASLAGWTRYESPISLVGPMIANFYRKTVAHYPWCRGQLDTRWIFDAVLEALGDEQGQAFLADLQATLRRESLEDLKGAPVSAALEDYISRPGSYLPLHLFNAIDRYQEWEMLNGDATASAREQTVEELYRLYQLFRFPEYVRYYLCRHTYFGHLPEAPSGAFDRLLDTMRTDLTTPPLQLTELSELQDALYAEADRHVFSRMVFQRSETRRGESAVPADETVTRISDRYGERYTFRETSEPREIGQLYRFFFNQNIPREITEVDRYYVVVDASERVVGGICYRMKDRVVQLDGIVVAASLQGRGIGSALEQEFSERMRRLGGEVIRAHFLRRFHLSRGYRIDKRWGTLVKFLN